MNPSPDTNIIRKIQKLFALANNPNEHEAAAAMGKAQELLAQYNLDMATIQDAAPLSTPEEPRTKTPVANRSAMYEWQQQLWKAIAEANFCWHWVANDYSKSNKGVKRHKILGRESNVISVTLMGGYLCDTIERLLPYSNQERLSRSAVSWRTGCSARLIERIKEQAAKLRTQPEANSTALTIFNVAQREYEANYDALYGKGAYAKAKAYQEKQRDLAKQAEDTVETAAEMRKREAANERYWRRQEAKSRQRASRVDWVAYSQGVDAGSSISLNSQVPQGQKQGMLK